MKQALPADIKRQIMEYLIEQDDVFEFGELDEESLNEAIDEVSMELDNVLDLTCINDEKEREYFVEDNYEDMKDFVQSVIEKYF